MVSNVASVSVPIIGVKSRVVAAVIATGAAVALPQILHVAGMAAGAGPAFAQMWLPMYLPVIMVGLLAGPQVGAVVGVLSPLVSLALTGMPAAALLPLMAVQLVVYGVVAGFVSGARLPLVAKTLAVVVSGPLAALATLSVAGLFTDAAWVSTPGAWWASLVVGLPGLVLQLVAVPLVAAWAARHK